MLHKKPIKGFAVFFFLLLKEDRVNYFVSIVLFPEYIKGSTLRKENLISRILALSAKFNFLSLRKEGQSVREMKVKMGEKVKMGKIFV